MSGAQKVEEDSETAIAANGRVDRNVRLEPTAYITYKGHLLHADDPKVAEHSEPVPLYAIPEGWAMVPKEPTPEMIAGFWGDITHGEPEISAAKDAYRAMLEALPNATVKGAAQ